MRPLYYLSALGLSGALLGTPYAIAQTYSITDLGIPPQAQFSEAAGINQSGQVIGYYGTNSPINFNLSSFVYSDGKVTLLDFVAEGIAGDDRKNPWEEGDKRKLRITGTLGNSAVLYQDNFLRTLGTLPGSSDSAGSAVNSSGEVAGVALYITGSEQAFLYKNGNMINLGALPGDPGAAALAINDAGDVTGVSATPNGYFGHAFLYHKDKMIDLGTLPGASVSWGLAINNFLQVAGYSYSTDFSIFHAFLWSNGKIKDLGVLPNGNQSTGNSINAWGQVVGTANVPQPGSPGSFLSHAFLYSNGKMYDLNSLIPPNSGWVILYAEGINDKGEIAATGTLNGTQHALLLTFDCKDRRNSECEPCRIGH
jgi:probable HAF family extracellular repeat protein